MQCDVPKNFNLGYLEIGRVSGKGKIESLEKQGKENQF